MAFFPRAVRRAPRRHPAPPRRLLARRLRGPRRPRAAGAGRRSGSRSGRGRARGGTADRLRDRSGREPPPMATGGATSTGATRSRPRPKSRRARSATGDGPRTCTDGRSRRTRRRRDRGPRSRVAARAGPPFREFADDRPREREIAGPLPVAGRPRASTRRTTSAGRPTPAAKANRRPLTRPSEMRRVRPAANASAICRAASTGSRGSPSARESTLVPPPGRNPIGTSESSPFSASLKPPSPEKTTTASAPPRQASVTSSVAWPGRSVRMTSSSPTCSSSSRTSASRSSLTRVANGLTTSATRMGRACQRGGSPGSPDGPPRMQFPWYIGSRKSNAGVLSSWVIQPCVDGSGDVFWNENAVPS